MLVESLPWGVIGDWLTCSLLEGLASADLLTFSDILLLRTAVMQATFWVGMVSWLTLLVVEVLAVMIIGD